VLSRNVVLLPFWFGCVDGWLEGGRAGGREVTHHLSTLWGTTCDGLDCGGNGEAARVGGRGMSGVSEYGGLAKGSMKEKRT
jgi:hypothetical protein